MPTDPVSKLPSVILLDYLNGRDLVTRKELLDLFNNNKEIIDTMLKRGRLIPRGVGVGETSILDTGKLLRSKVDEVYSVSERLKSIYTPTNIATALGGGLGNG